MEYTIQKLSLIAGISTRTLRYYDEIGLLKPSRVNSSGYRIYGEKEVDLLQQIMFYKELGFNLDNINKIISSPNYDEIKALKSHHKMLLEKSEQINLLIQNVKKTIEMRERNLKMSNSEKFRGFKENMINENEKKYGKEVREKYGDETVNNSNQHLYNMTEEEYLENQRLTVELLETLKEAFKTNDPAGPLAQKAAEIHKKWLSFYWPDYSKEAHAGLAQMYVEDERFKAYYDQEQPGLTEFLRDAIFIYTGKKQNL